MNAVPDVLLTLGVSLLVQAVFFVFAATFRTDKVTDLSYSLTFIVLSLVLVVRTDGIEWPQVVLTFMVVAWGLRLATYLFVRILVMKRDPRFDGIREDFWKFLQFWLFQGIAAWAIMLPVTVGFAAAGAWSPAMAVGLAIWVLGLVIETVADLQKFRQKRDPSSASRWMSSGLWRYSRHPNYLGEILCWWGVFVYVSNALSGWGWISIAGPVVVTCLLLWVTGIPTLEKSALEKWGQDPAYQAYRASTPLLVPLPFVSDRSH